MQSVFSKHMSTLHVKTIPSSLPFLKVLAEELVQRYGTGEALSSVLLLLPTRRACLTMREMFLEVNGGTPLLLPRIYPLGDIDTDVLMAPALYATTDAVIPEAISTQHRAMRLARFIYDRAQQDAVPLIASLEHALTLAESLSALMDDFARYRMPLDRLATLVDEEEFAEHWQITLDFLHVIIEQWPEEERRLGVRSMVACQDIMLFQLAHYWREHPPEHPVIAAGSTGSIPATAELLEVIACLAQGEVVLAGLDTRMDDVAWNAIGPTHPQYMLRQLLARMKLHPADVEALVGREGKRPEREELLRTVMLPPGVTHRWAEADHEVMKAGMDGVECVACYTQDHEAAAIALRMRQVLENPGHNAMYVTPDRALARRVSGMLSMYGIEVDDSSGRALTETAPAVFFQLIIECAALDAAPVPLLALLRHPLCRIGKNPAEIRRLSREIEVHLLRGLRPPGGLQGLYERAIVHEKVSPEAAQLLASLQRIMDKLLNHLTAFEKPELPFQDMLQEHIHVAEQLALSNDEKDDGLWESHEGHALHTMLSGLLAEAQVLGRVNAMSYAGVLSSMLAPVMYQPPYGGHPRLKILSPIEARLQLADVMILGGLNEGVWPSDTPADAWLNDRMRMQLGLPNADTHVGQSAHDMAMLCMAPEVMITRAVKAEGAPSIPSRFWLRLEAVIGEEAVQASGGPWAAWGRQLFSSKEFEPLEEPQPCVPAAYKPTTYYVTHIEKLMRDPYQFYAMKILELYPLEALDADLSVSEFGVAVHEALRRFYTRYPDTLPADALNILLQEGRETLQDHFHHVTVEAFWWPRFEVIAQACIHEDTVRRDAGMVRVESEKDIERPLRPEGRDISIRARVDRLEVYANGSQIIVDYKTGGIPNVADVKRGVACQLLLEAWILAGQPGELNIPEYWKLSGSDRHEMVQGLFGKTGSDDDYIASTQEGVANVLSYFMRPDARYLVCPDPNIAPEYNNFDHLERLREWMM